MRRADLGTRRVGQAQILNLLPELQQSLSVSCLFITHDIAVVACLADRIAVMNRGCIEEIGPAAQARAAAVQTHARRLLAAVPRLADRER